MPRKSPRAAYLERHIPIGHSPGDTAAEAANDEPRVEVDDHAAEKGCDAEGPAELGHVPREPKDPCPHDVGNEQHRGLQEAVAPLWVLLCLEALGGDEGWSQGKGMGGGEGRGGEERGGEGGPPCFCRLYFSR